MSLTTAAEYSHVLTYEELLDIGFSEKKTTRKYRVSEDGNVHVLRLTTDWKGTPHNDMTMWLIIAEKSIDGVTNLWKDVIKEGERTNGKVAFYDLGDAKEWPLVLEILMLSDAKLYFGAYELRYDSAIGHLGYIVGNGVTINHDTAEMAGLIACTIANHIGPKFEFLKDACERVNQIAKELTEIGVKTHRGVDHEGGE